ncbi:hypothetical protein MIR68_011702 [Amoeboaphelidium protococcarum]|nr:hypothetical protein MIR68_011702 [Amoeboaphelidium protococcarum]
MPPEKDVPEHVAMFVFIQLSMEQQRMSIITLQLTLFIAKRKTNHLLESYRYIWLKGKGWQHPSLSLYKIPCNLYQLLWSWLLEYELWCKKLQTLLSLSDLWDDANSQPLDAKETKLELIHESSLQYWNVISKKKRLQRQHVQDGHICLIRTL